MGRLWKQISPAEAKEHHLYGVKNWLVVFAVGVLLGGLQGVGELNAQAHKVGLTMGQLLALDHPATTLLKTALILHFGTVAALYWMLFTRHPKFRQVASALLLLSWPAAALQAAINPFDGVGVVLGLSFVPWLSSCGVWVTYLNRSRRVRVTFENQVLQSEGVGALVPAVARKPTTPGSTQLRSLMPVATGLPPHALCTPPIRQEATTMTKPSALSHLATEEDFWAAALHEVDGPTRKTGLWAKTFALANGNAAEAKAAYLRERVLQIEQESKEAVEHHKRQLAEAADLERQALRKSLGENRAELLDCVQFAKLNTSKTPTKVVVNIVRLLGGQVGWGSTGILSSGWIVELNGNLVKLRDDGELYRWFLETVLPTAESSLPERSDALPVGCCPSCDAVIPLNIASCLGCEESFAVGSACKPVPRGLNRADGNA